MKYFGVGFDRTPLGIALKK